MASEHTLRGAEAVSDVTNWWAILPPAVIVLAWAASIRWVYARITSGDSELRRAFEEERRLRDQQFQRLLAESSASAATLASIHEAVGQLHAAAGQSETRVMGMLTACQRLHYGRSTGDG